MCKFSSKSGGVPFQISFFWGDLTRNDPYRMQPNTMQLIEHNTMKATHAMPHKTQPMPPMQLFGCIAV